MKSYIHEKYSVKHNKRIIVVPPGGPVLSLTPNNARHNNVVYAGLVNTNEHVDLFAQSIPFVKHSASFFISNKGDNMVNHIKKITKGNPAVNWFWIKKRGEILDFLSRSKIGVLPSSNNICRQIGTPLKLFDYMACGLPVVANHIGGWTELIEKEGVGLLSKDDPTDFAQSIDMLLGDDSLWHKMHNSAINLIKTKYNWQRIVDDVLIPLYIQVLNH
jgi:colanic acid biosynthesis glycosyl transferase WcaI